jgi:hypothetical protein
VRFRFSSRIVPLCSTFYSSLLGRALGVSRVNLSSCYGNCVINCVSCETTTG